MLAWTAARVTSWARTVSVVPLRHMATGVPTRKPRPFTSTLVDDRAHPVRDLTPPRLDVPRGGAAIPKIWPGLEAYARGPCAARPAGQRSGVLSVLLTPRHTAAAPDSPRVPPHKLPRSVGDVQAAGRGGGRLRLPAAGWSDESSCPASLRRATCTGLGWAADDGLMGRDPRVRDGCLRSYAHGTSGPSAHLAGRVNAVRGSADPALECAPLRRRVRARACRPLCARRRLAGAFESCALARYRVRSSLKSIGGRYGNGSDVPVCELPGQRSRGDDVLSEACSAGAQPLDVR